MCTLEKWARSERAGVTVVNLIARRCGSKERRPVKHEARITWDSLQSESARLTCHVLRHVSDVQGRIVDDPGRRPVAAVVGGADVEKEGVELLAANAVRIVRSDVVLGRQVIDAGTGEVMHAAIGGK